MLAVLLLASNQPVARDQIIDAVWGERPPPSAVNIVHQYIARLRQVLQPGRPSRAAPRRLASTTGGYLLRVETDELDALRFARLTEQARRLRADGAAEGALATLEAALGLWRGLCLADLDGPIRSHSRVVALDRQWCATVLELADLALGLARITAWVVSRWVASWATLQPSSRRARRSARRSTCRRSEAPQQLGLDVAGRALLGCG